MTISHDNSNDQTLSLDASQVMKSMKIALCSIGDDFQILSADEQLVTITGYSLDDLIHKSLFDCLLPTEQEKYQNQLKKFFTEDDMSRLELPIKNKEVGSCWIAITILHKDEKQCQIAIQDVTNIYRRSDRRASALVQAISDMIMVVNRQKVIIEFYPGNSTAQRFPAEEIIGKSLRDGVIADDMAEEVIYYVDRAIDTAHVQAFEFHSFVDENETRYYDVRIAPINSSEAMAIVREITDLKRVQEELSKHIEDLTILRQVDAELADKLKIERATQLGLDAMMRLSNARSGFVALLEAEQLKLIHIIGHYVIPQLNDYLERDDTLIAEVLRNKKPVWLVGNDLKMHANYVPLIERSVALIIIPLVLQNRMIGLVNLETIVEDDFGYETYEFLQLMVGRIAVSLENARLVAQINWQLEEQQRLYEQVSRLEQIKTDMIRIASHDLRNPLAAILGYLEMLSWDFDDGISEAHQEYIRNIDEAARRMQKITSDILSLERIEESALHNTSESFDLNNLIQQTYNEHRPNAQLKKHNYSVELPSERVVVEADPIQLHEAIANLVGNAIKYTPDQGEVRLTLDVFHNTARIRVIDNGYGIPEEKQERLFQPFYRAKTKETETIQGTGLGLHLVKSIIERFNGTLVYKSVHRKGSTFGFDMPLSDKDPDTPSTMRNDVDGSVIVG